MFIQITLITKTSTIFLTNDLRFIKLLKNLRVHQVTITSRNCKLKIHKLTNFETLTFRKIIILLKTFLLLTIIILFEIF